MLLSVIIPVYNERSTIRELVRRVKEIEIEKEIVIVDDGSKDGTKEVLEELKREDSALIVYTQEVNRGKGAAIREGLGRVSGDYVILQDADLELDPKDYFKILQRLEGGAEVVYGSRFLGKGYFKPYPDATLLTKFGNLVLAELTSLLWGVSLTDEATSYKAFKREILQGMHIASTGFDFCPEVTGKLLNRKIKIVEVPIDYHPRTVKEGKKVSFRDGVTALSTLIRLRISGDRG